MAVAAADSHIDPGGRHEWPVVHRESDAMSPGMASSWAAPFRTGTAVRWLLALLALAALPVLLHGCHGDEDNELFAPLVRSRPAASVVHFE